MGGVKTCWKHQGVGNSTGVQCHPWFSRDSGPVPSLSAVTAVWQCWTQCEELI